MEERFIYCGTKKCAAAIQRAPGPQMLQRLPRRRFLRDRRQIILLPKGERLQLEIANCTLCGGTFACTVIKDSGDDLDITNGIEIIAEVSLIDSGVDIVGGKGVGTITKAGLDQPVGMAKSMGIIKKHDMN